MKTTTISKNIKSKLISAASISPLVGILICISVLILCAKNPGQALASLFTGTFATPYAAGSFLNTASLLMVAGIGAALSIKSGNMNLGGEGQIYVGGYVAACILTASWNVPAPVVFIVALLSSLLAGSIMALFSAVLYELRGALVLLTSFLLSAAVIPLIDGVIVSSNKATGSNLLATPFIGKQFQLQSLLPPSPCNISFFISILLCVAAFFFLYRTYAGRKMQVWGTAPLFARYCGYSRQLNTYGSLALSGCFHALTGFLAVVGTYYTCHKGFYSGMGWNALSAALISQSNPLVLIPVSFILSWLYTSADRVSLTQGFAFDISGIIQGIILFSIAIPFTVQKIRQAKNITHNKAHSKAPSKVHSKTNSNKQNEEEAQK